MIALLPQWIFSLLIYGAVALAAIAAVGLIALLLLDRKNGELW